MKQNEINPSLVWKQIDEEGLGYVPVGITFLDQTGEIIMLNHEFEKTFGYDRGELKGVNIKELISKVDQSEFDLFWKKFTKDPTAFSNESQELLKGITKKGEIVYLKVKIKYVEKKGNPLFSCAITEVYEELKQLDETRKVNYLLDQAEKMANMFHYEVDIKKNKAYISDQEYKILGCKSKADLEVSIDSLKDFLTVH